MAKRKPTPKRQWTPMEHIDVIPASPETVARVIELAAGRTDDEELLGSSFGDVTRPSECWANDLYLVDVSRDLDGAVRQLCIRRRDHKPLRDWRDFMRIKNEIAGEETEAVELFPAMSRLVETGNQYWLWCLPPALEFEIGFSQRAVFDAGEVPGIEQRPLGGFATPGVGASDA